jgi:D-3-phosphoglycerate dehydrogenase / 2-oxoglutarate reductase
MMKEHRMSTYRVVVTDQVFPDVDTERALLADFGAELEVADGPVEAVLERARDADALLNTYLAFDAAALGQLERCKVIARYGIGVDNIDLEAARAAGIVVTNVPDYCLEEVGVHALALMLALYRRLPEADASVRAGGWGIADLRPIGRVSELTVGLVGYGQIARRLATALLALGADVVAFDPYVDAAAAHPVRLVDLDELLASADIVSLHVPLTPDTRGLIGRAELERMRNDALLVNTSRGPLVVLDDLVEALRAGTIRGAALDVYEQEPPDPSRFEGVPGLLLTPHMAFYSEAAIRESQRKAATQVIKVLRGEEPDYRVN